jgi:hypothetical protein
MLSQMKAYISNIDLRCATHAMDISLFAILSSSETLTLQIGMIPLDRKLRLEMSLYIGSNFLHPKG